MARLWPRCDKDVVVKVKSQKDFCAGLMFIVLGLAFAAGALNYHFGSSAQPGPGFFPFGLGMLLALLGGTILFRSLSIEREGGERIGALPWRPLLLLPASVVIFGFALEPLGLAVALPLLILGCSLAGDEFRLREVLANCVVLTVASWLIFIEGLGLVIPLWPALPVG